MANSPIYLFSLLVLILGCYNTRSSHAYQFIVGGKDGWVLNPSENYNQWAERNRFSVNDTLLFKYNKGSDSLMVVNKNDYDNCNNGNPILKLDDGNSVFTFNRSGPFYFISGNKDNCDKGQKLIVVVLAVRNRPTPPLNTPPPVAAPPNVSPTTSPASSPLSPSPAAKPPSGGSPSPAASPHHHQSPSPAASPDHHQAPSPANLGSGPSSSTTPGSPIPSDGNNPADSNAPGGSSTPRSFAAPSCSSPSVLLILVSAVSVMLTLSLGA